MCNGHAEVSQENDYATSKPLIKESIHKIMSRQRAGRLTVAITMNEN